MCKLQRIPPSQLQRLFILQKYHKQKITTRQKAIYSETKNSNKTLQPHQLISHATKNTYSRTSYANITKGNPKHTEINTDQIFNSLFNENIQKTINTFIEYLLKIPNQ